MNILGLGDLSTSESNNTFGFMVGFFAGGTIIVEFPIVNSPVNTRTRYMYLCPLASGGEYVWCAE